MTRVQRTAPIARDVGAVDRKPSGLVPGAREVVLTPRQPRTQARDSAHAGERVAGVFGGPLSSEAHWSGHQGPVSRSRRR